MRLERKGMIRDILCDSDCVYIENGICEKQNDISMSRIQIKESKMVIFCTDYIPKKEKE